MRSQIRTRESSPPEASVPRREGDHSMQFMGALCPDNSKRAWPGWRTSRTRITLDSWLKVARWCASKGDAVFLLVSFLCRGGGVFKHTCEPEQGWCVRHGLLRFRGTNISRARSYV
jgi:hypothetical protein